jgi:hypothetical protein
MTNPHGRKIAVQISSTPPQNNARLNQLLCSLRLFSVAAIPVFPKALPRSRGGVFLFGNFPMFARSF